MTLLAARLPRLTLSAAEAPTIAVPEDQAIVRDAIRGGRAAFEELYRRYARMVHGILLARVAPQIVSGFPAQIRYRLPMWMFDHALGRHSSTAARIAARTSSVVSSVPARKRTFPLSISCFSWT